MMSILTDVYAHHMKVKERGYEPVFTVLIGSQNYKLDSANSDIDTFTFILPSAEDLAFAREPKSGEFEVEDGKCMYKDIRLALNLLKKTSPNSVEYFLGKYRYYNSVYAGILEKYLDNETILNYMIHCNYSHMLYAMAGMAHQLTKRNMPAGKRYSHALRLYSMSDTFLDSIQSDYLLELLPRDYQEAFDAKRDVTGELDAYYNQMCDCIAELLDKRRNCFEMTEYKREIERKGLDFIESLQKELMHYYIKYIL
jgi:predicted nucleotidyltransferase